MPLSFAQRTVRDAAIVSHWKRADCTITEIAKYFNISRDTVYRALRAAGEDTTPRALKHDEPETLDSRLLRLEQRVRHLEEWRSAQRVTYQTPTHTVTPPFTHTYTFN